MNEMKLVDAQLYNADESGLFFRLLPHNTFVAATKKIAPRSKTAKDRVTFLLCSNADGSNKVTPMVVGKSAKPRCFKGFENPVVFRSSRSSWITSALFHDWFHKSFVKEVRKFSAENNLLPKAILLMDNCTAQKPIELLRSDDGNIVAMLLPPNVTAVVQPMDQNPIKLVKLAYRIKLLCNIVAQDEIPVDVSLKGVNIRDAIVMLKRAWDKLPQTVLQNAWKRMKNWDNKDYEEEDDIP